MRAKALVAARVGLLLVLAVSAWRANNYRSDYEPGPDSSIFMSIGWHVHAGRVLYKEELSGPPMIYALDAMALTMGGDGVNSVRTMERGFAGVGVAAIFVAALLGFGRFWLAWATSALYLIHLFRLNVMEDGNVTEEYGAAFVLVGITCAIAAWKSRGRQRIGLGAASGVAFSLAVLCKEPFVLIAPPWFLFLAWPRQADWRAARRDASAFLVGVAAPLMVFLGYLISHGAWGAWIDSLATSVAYTASGPAADATFFPLRLLVKMNAKVAPMLVASVAAVFGVAALARWRFVRALDGLPIAIVASTALSLVATALGGRYFGHYYMFFVPSFALLCAWGIASVTDVVSPSRRLSAVAVLGALALLFVDAKDLGAFTGNLTVPAKRWKGHWLSELVRRNTSPGDLIWTPWKPLLYVETQHLAPTKWQSVFDSYFVDTPASSTADKFRTLQAELMSNPPRAIVISALPGAGPTRGPADQFLQRSGLAPWIASTYRAVLCGPNGSTDLLLRKDLPMRAPTPMTSDSAAMQAGLASLYEQNDPTQALACFRMILARTPSHYGAHFQVAKTLDAMGLASEATTEWQTVLRLAREAGDQVTEGLALARLR